MTKNANKVTVASLCYQLDEINSWQDFTAKINDYVRQAKAQNVDILQFGEFLTIDLMRLINNVEMPELWLAVDKYTDPFNQLFADLANAHNIWIIAGSHVQQKGGIYRNTSSMFGPGSIKHDYSKAHLFGAEKTLGATGGDGLPVFDTPFGKVGIQLCYDLQFPEGSRLLAREGAQIIFCPAYTVGAQGYWRVRHCAHARAIENSLYVVLSNTIGVVERSTVGAGFGQAVVTCPSGVNFPPAGLLSQGEVNSTDLLVTELDMDKITQYRQNGETDPLNDQRHDLYTIVAHQ